MGGTQVRWLVPVTIASQEYGDRRGLTFFLPSSLRASMLTGKQHLL